MLDPVIAIAVGAVSGLWVVLGVGSAISHASDKPTQHSVEVRGAVAHVVVQPEQKREQAPARQIASAVKPRTRMIECPECSLLIGYSAANCPCGWQVPGSLLVSAPEVAQPRADVGEVAQDVGTAQPAATKPRVSPACPQCRAPTAWTDEFQRFYCSRCDAYL